MNRWLDSAVEAYIDRWGKTPNPVVYEVGSRDGHDGVELAKRIKFKGENRLWDLAKIVLFECNPPQADYIRRHYPYAKLYEAAAWNKNGKITFNQFDGNIDEIGSSSIRDDWQPTIKKRKKITVQAIRLDGVIPPNEQIDIMKIDVEGCTWEVLQGLGDRLHNVRVYHLETETKTSTKKITEFMQANGYELYTTEHEWGEWLSDQVWIKKNPA